jgi:cell division protein FtsB
MPAHSRRAWKTFFYSNIFLGLVVGALIFIVINLARVYYQNHQVELEIARLQSEASRLESKRLETLDALKFTDSPSFIEQKARTQFNLVRPGESVAVLPTKVASQSHSQDLSYNNTESNPMKWWRVFFKK